MKIIERREHPGLATLYLAGLDGEDRCVEFVDTLEPGVAKSEKWVMMISTQVGCPVGCRMCDAGTMGYFGNLSADEILAQVRHIVAANPGLSPSSHPKLKIHFARMGEPSLNPDTLKALRMLAEEYPHAGVMPSLSTVAPLSPAVDPFFKELAQIKDACFSGGRFQLQFSIHSLDEHAKRGIVPIKTWPLEKIADYGARFVGAGDRKITLNFALAPGEVIETEKLRRIFPSERFLIKITPVNPTRTADRNGATHVWSDAPSSLQACAGVLRSMGFEVILSPSLPEEIAAATSCGQLWSESLMEKAEVMARNRRREERSYVTVGTLAEKSRSWQTAVASHRRRELKPRSENTGLLVVDMQEFFLSPRSPAYRPAARAILNNALRLVETFRRRNRPIFFTRHAHKTPSEKRNALAVWWGKACVEGTKWAELSPLLGAQDHEIVKKCRYSAFSNPALKKILRAQNVSELVIAGVMTNLCVESTARDAFDSGFKVWTVLDATAAHTEEFHTASLKSLAQGFSSMITTEEVASSAPQA